MSWKELKPEDLRYTCDLAEMHFNTTAEVSPLDEFLGQERAVKATEFGLTIKQPGYNIFITGLTGTGRASYAQSIINKIAPLEPVPCDWCYVFNFESPGEPIALDLPAGQGTVFVRDMEELVEDLKETIPKAFDSEDYERQKGVYVKEFQESRSVILDELNRAAQEQGFSLRRTSSGFVTVPLVDDEPISEEEYARLEQPVKNELEKKSASLQLKALEIMRRIQKAEKELKDKFKQLDQRVGLMSSGHLFHEIMEKYSGNSKVLEYLRAVKKDVLSNLGDFRGDEEEQPQTLPFLRRPGHDQREFRYQVNLVVDHRETTGAPVVYETNPSYYNLLGRVEYENRLGMVVTEFTMIKGGAFHRANDGYLILQARDVLNSMQSWDVLKRALKTREIRIENMAEHYGLVAMSTLRPQPIPLNLNVIMIGNSYLYQLLYHYDEDFRKLFKIKADFDVEMKRTPENINKMAAFTSTHCRRRGLRHFDRTALVRMVEYSCRLAEHQGKLSTRFNEIVELLYEADAWAGIEGADTVTAAHVCKAEQEKINRSNKYEEKLLEAMAEGQVLLEVSGAKIGQINALSVIDLGDYRFGRPSRITAAVALGRRGIINIERESKLSGRLHDKGILILGGFLGKRYGSQVPLNLSASLCFEQSYSGVEGDSASAAELFVLLSAIAGVPLKQELAVTGSVNQKGEIQPIGGVNHKIEGYFAACRILGLTGAQGVLIPSRNRQNLMLNEAVVEAVREGRFHIYSIDTVDEGLELLTGKPAGKPLPEGGFEPGSFNEWVLQRLRQMNEALKREGAGPKDDGNDGLDKPFGESCGQY